MTKKEFLQHQNPDAKALQNEPDLPEYLEWYPKVFQELSSCRPVGFSRGPIPWTAIDRYAVRDGITDRWEFDRFMMLIRAMDNAYLDHCAKKEQGTKANDGRNNRNRAGPATRRTRGR